MTESRHARRNRALFGGKVVLRDGSMSFDCVIRDLSESGARIALREEQLIPKRFLLLCTARHTAFDAEIVWRRGPLCGLHFHGSHDLETATGPELQAVKRLFNEYRPRSSPGL